MSAGRLLAGPAAWHFRAPWALRPTPFQLPYAFAPLKFLGASVGSDLRADRQHWSPWTYDLAAKPVASESSLCSVGPEPGLHGLLPCNGELIRMQLG